MSEDMFDVFRGTVTANYLDDNVIDLIHERYMVLVHIDENAHSTIRAALQRAWVTYDGVFTYPRYPGFKQCPLSMIEKLDKYKSQQSARYLALCKIFSDH